MRTIIQWNDADPMEHLDKDCDVARTLNDLIGVVVSSWEHGWPHAVHMDAAHGQRLVLNHIGCSTHPFSCRGPLGGPLFSLFRQRRESPGLPKNYGRPG